ncbi:MAG: hypothetical protein PHQ86_01040 [Dehalococcoidales bacterium]|nr:hypothetical protein [Dehalococcoidales bacterium]
MGARYYIGQRVTIKLHENQVSSVRDSDIEQYSGQNGIVTNYYWIRPNTGEVFYTYTVQIADSQKEIVLYEDEMEFY